MAASLSVTRTCTDAAGNSGTRTSVDVQVRRHSADRQPDGRSQHGPQRLVQPRRHLDARADGRDQRRWQLPGSGRLQRRGQRHSVRDTHLYRSGRQHGQRQRQLQVRRHQSNGEPDADRAADHNDWYDHAVTWTPSQTDATSGADSCQAAVAYSGPDSSSASLTASCTDLAGNTGSAGVGFQYDGTKPVVNVTASRAADSGGWYNHPVSFSASTSSDATSLIDSCGTDVVYSGPDTSSGSQSFTCTDLAGNSSSSSIAFNYDATNPTSTITFPGGGPYDAVGWNDGCGTGAEKICGTAGDNLSGVAQVQVSIQQGSGNYWGGSSFNSAGENRITAAGTRDWTLAFRCRQLPRGQLHRPGLRHRQGRQRASSNSAQTFTIDTTPPTPALTRVNGDTVTFPFATSYPVTAVGGTCATATGDAATVNWSVSAGATDSGSTTCSSGSWTATLTTPLTTATGYTITVTQSDSAGNTGSTGSKSITIDAPPA